MMRRPSSSVPKCSAHESEGLGEEREVVGGEPGEVREEVGGEPGEVEDEEAGDEAEGRVQLSFLSSGIGAESSILVIPSESVSEFESQSENRLAEEKSSK
jgi:hypothetical protein